MDNRPSQLEFYKIIKKIAYASELKIYIPERLWKALTTILPTHMLLLLQCSEKTCRHKGHAYKVAPTQ